METNKVVIGWFERNDYPKILEIMEDPHKLPTTFDEWEKHTLAAEEEMQVIGREIVRFVIKPDAFMAWCHEHGEKADAQARVRFGNEHIAHAHPAEPISP